MLLNHARYVYPPRAIGRLPFEESDFMADQGYLAQLKFNDSRCLIKHLPDGRIQLWNRHGERFRDYHAPDHLIGQLGEVFAAMGLAPDEFHLLDGGLLDKKHRAISDTVVIWDVLVARGEYLLGSTYGSRFALLEAHGGAPKSFENHSGSITLGRSLTEDIFIPDTIAPEAWRETWERLKRLNSAYAVNSPLIEGLMYKDYSGTLSPGYSEKNNSSWQARSRVSTGRHKF